MGNASFSEKKREKEKCVGIEKKLDEEEKRSQKTANILIMGQGTVNFLNALQCIRDNGIGRDIRLQCKAYIYHQMIFEMKSIIKKSIDNEHGVTGKEWSNQLFKHCVTDSLLIYGFIKSFMIYDKIKRKYSISARQVIWNQILLEKEKNNNHNINDDITNYDNRVYVSSDIMTTIMSYYQSHDTIQQWLNILFFSNKSGTASSLINHYILNHVNIGSFINDIFNEFNDEQQNKLLIHYDLSVAHYFQHLNIICNDDYIPTDKDMILMSKSIGSCTNSKYHKIQNELKDLEFRSSIYHFTNIQPMFRTAIKRWIFQFEDNCDGLLFLIPLTTYYKWDSKWDTFNLITNFQSITNNNWLKQCSFHLFLTGKDSFKQNIKESGFKFTDFNKDPSNHNECIQFLINYLKSKLIADNKGDKRQIYVHVVSLYSPESLEGSFGEVCSVINGKNNKYGHHTQMSSQKFEF